MDAVTSPTTASATATSQSSAATQAATASLTSDFETFLQMLTAQAEYQDPLDPIDSSEYAAQLAQFSMVEQQVLTNDTLAELVSQLSSSNLQSLSGWVGMDVRAAVAAEFDGTPITVAPNPDATADQAVLVVRNAAGDEVQRLDIPVSTDQVAWAGVQDDGTPFAAGSYQFTVESWSNGQVISETRAEIYSRVTEVQSSGDAAVLVLQGGQTVAASDVTALREAV
ncbi:MAG: flagellar hook capping FlgD N-terminal domain-containing protein [Pseudomonadota bacterium]